MNLHLSSTDKIRALSDPRINYQIDKRMEENIRKYAYQGSHEISERIKELEKEWDIERALQLNAATFAFTGLALSLKNKKWLFLTGTVLSFLALQAVKGWCPPVPVFRKLGFRTRQEIECEIYALKYLRGDFTEFQSGGKRDADMAIKEALIAVK